MINKFLSIWNHEEDSSKLSTIDRGESLTYVSVSFSTDSLIKTKYQNQTRPELHSIIYNYNHRCAHTGARVKQKAAEYFMGSMGPYKAITNSYIFIICKL